MSRMTTAEQVMLTHLLIAVRLHDGRYHGAGDHPPAPARLFQALVAGVGLARPDELKNALPTLEWIESLAPPVVAVPSMVKGQRVKNYVPNNDLDAKGGDLRRIGAIRTDKASQPWLFDGDIPLLFVWELGAREEDERMARTACELAEHLYQFGRGVDMAWAWGEVLDGLAIEERLLSYPGQVFRPSRGESGTSLPCPKRGSFVSLKTRYEAGTRRFTASAEGKQLFAQQPKPHFDQVAYDSPPSRHVFELRMNQIQSALATWPLSQASTLVVLVRDAALKRLRDALPSSRTDIDRFLVGRKPDGADAAPAGSRIRILPMPSIGHQYADHGIRRVLVEVPATFPLRSDDVRWAFSGLDVIDQDTGEVFDLVLTPSTGGSMLSHYCATGDSTGFRVWRTVTPAALPEGAKRRRIEPTRAQPEAKDGHERAAEQARAAASVHQALRHAQITASVDSIRVQREPFTSRGDRVEDFAAGTRFDKHRLWHTEITFSSPVRGPLVIGDGRFLGLGVLAPLKQHRGAYALVVHEGLVAAADALEVTRALRRAVMARVQAMLPRNAELHTFFSGHEADGSPARSADHLTFAFDPRHGRLLVVSPHVCGRRSPTREETKHLETLERALAGFHELRAGPAGLLRLRTSSIIDQEDPLFLASRRWESVTRYQVTRHTKNVAAAEALSDDVRAECRRRGLPQPCVTTSDLQGIPGVGLVGYVQLDFDVALEGPIMLGRTRHLGGGLFAVAKRGDAS